MAGMFAGLESYRLSGVRLTEEEFGRGSYAVVLRLEYRGLKCAGKQLYPVLYEQGVGDTVRRFEEECRLLAQMRHPNIVQFIGVYFEEGSRVPILVMEFLPTTLAGCIDSYGVLPEEVSYSILHDVALGLYHLHSHTPSIVHRDLSANNVLLDSNMAAKISDLGVARILNLTPQQMSCMTHAPGTPAYMPPETMRANARYDASIDEFSYGILMIHVLCGKWPLPVCEAARPDPRNPDQLIPVSEADRREEYIQDIGNAHPLMDLILRCVSNNPAGRARAAESVQRLGDMIHQFPPSFADRVKMLQRIETEINEKQMLRAESQRLAVEARQCKGEVEQVVTKMNKSHEAVVERILTEMTAQNQTHQAELEQVRSDIRAQIHQAELKQVRTEVTAELNAQNTAAQTQLRGEIQRLELLAQHRQEEIERSEVVHSVEIEQTRLQLAHSDALQSELRTENETFQARLKFENETHQVAVAQKESTLKHQSSIIRGLNEQLTRAREFLSGQKPQPHPLHPQAKITWKPCSDLPVKLHGAQTVVIGDRVYCGGGDSDDYQVVFCNCPSEDTWNRLTACDMQYFGLSQVRGKLVTVGGKKKSNDKVTNEVCEFDEVTHNWKQSIPPMPTARHSPAVLSYHSILTVAGGSTGNTHTSVVELFREETSQWHTIEPLPFRWCAPSSLLIDNRWYLQGGRTEGQNYSNRAVCAHVGQLLQKVLPHDEASADSTNNSAWEVLPNTPFYGPAAATFGASLLAVGGIATYKWPLNLQQSTAAVHVYSPCSNAWIHISDLPAPLMKGGTAMLSPTELLVIGDWNADRLNSVYKGLLQIE